MNSTGDATRAGVIRAIISGENQTIASNFVMPVLLRKMAGIMPTQEERRLIAGLGIRSDMVDTYLDEASEQFRPYFETLRTNGITLGIDGNWDFSRAQLRSDQIRRNPSLNTALRIFFSPTFADGLVDSDRTEAIQVGSTVFLPPARNSGAENNLIRAFPRAEYERIVRRNLDQFEQEISTFLNRSREASSYGNMMRGRVWELFGSDRGLNGQGPVEIERDSAGRRALGITNVLRQYGVNREQLRLLNQTMGYVANIDSNNITEGLRRVNWAQRAAIAAPFIPLAIFAAPFAGAAAGISSTIMTATSATMALLPMGFALAKSGIAAGINAYHHGGNYFCYFAEQLQSQGASALFHAPFLAALPSAIALSAAGVGLAATTTGLAAAPAAVVSTTHGALHLGSALAFLGTGTVGASLEVRDCIRTLTESRRALEAGESGRANELASRGWNECASGGVDLAFAVIAARQLALQMRSNPNTPGSGGNPQDPQHTTPGGAQPPPGAPQTPSSTQPTQRIAGLPRTINGDGASIGSPPPVRGATLGNRVPANVPANSPQLVGVGSGSSGFPTGSNNLATLGAPTTRPNPVGLPALEPAPIPHAPRIPGLAPAPVRTNPIPARGNPAVNPIAPVAAPQPAPAIPSAPITLPLLPQLHQGASNGPVTPGEAPVEPRPLTESEATRLRRRLEIAFRTLSPQEFERIFDLIKRAIEQTRHARLDQDGFIAPADAVAIRRLLTELNLRQDYRQRAINALTRPSDPSATNALTRPGEPSAGQAEVPHALTESEARRLRRRLEAAFPTRSSEEFERIFDLVKRTIEQVPHRGALLNEDGYLDSANAVVVERLLANQNLTQDYLERVIHVLTTPNRAEVEARRNLRQQGWSASQIRDFLATASNSDIFRAGSGSVALESLHRYRSDPPRRTLERWRENPQRIVRAALIDASEINGAAPIRRVVVRGDPGEGLSNEGVFAVTNRHGQSVLIKFSRPSAIHADGPQGEHNPFHGQDPTHTGFQDYILIHRLLSDLGYAPELHGVMLAGEALSVAQTLNRLRSAGIQTQQPMVAIVMEHISEGWNMSRAGRVPDYVKMWSADTLASVLTRMKTMETTLNELGITAADTQFFITQTPGGHLRVILGDIDQYHFRRPGHVEADKFEDNMRTLVDFWERATGRTFSRERFRELTGYSRNRH